ncbi:MAG: transporter substrate-binding domain-containing protein [Spirochaetaceae bacterium]|jgi:putative glutamine transport system substrate-binding protein|nr:transporter substrate-binding domain-containing protein [Spirochaetaceae bacterium]
MKQVNFFFFLFAAVGLFASGNQDKEMMNRMGRTPGYIRQVGLLRVGIHFDLPMMGAFDKDSEQYYGYEVEIARLLADGLLNDESKVEFVPVTGEQREEFLDNGSVDVVIATFGKFEPRAANYNISSPYYTDFVELMVRSNSDFQGLADLNGRSIGVIKGTSTMQSITAAAATIGVHPNFYEFSRFSEIKAALDSGLLDVFASARTVLARYYDSTTDILPDRFAPREYGIVTRLSNGDLADFVEQRVQQWLREGILDVLREHYGL